jgi:hypothetical protein
VGLGVELYRATRDADLGVPLMAAQDPSLVTRLEDVGYERLAGNRFGRVLDDIPVKGVDDNDRRAVISPTSLSRGATRLPRAGDDPWR